MSNRNEALEAWASQSGTFAGRRSIRVSQEPSVGGWIAIAVVMGIDDSSKSVIYAESKRSKSMHEALASLEDRLSSEAASVMGAAS